jgi:hypothetical protein
VQEGLAAGCLIKVRASSLSINDVTNTYVLYDPPH